MFFADKTKTTTKRYRIAIQRIAGLACLEGAKYLHDHKNFTFCFASRRNFCRACQNPGEVSCSGTPNARHTEPPPQVVQKNTNYVPLQTREHAWAGMSGTLRFGGARGAFYVPRR